METTTHLALSRLSVLRQNMDIIANNIANATTTGFKAEALLLEPVPVDVGRRQTISFVQDVARVRDLSAGTFTPTGNQFDLAIEGDGYFVAQTPEGPRYTRGGQFALNAGGALSTAAGHPVLDDGGQQIVLPPDAGDLAIAKDGTMSVQGAIVGRIGVVTFANHQELRKAGEGLYMTEQAPEPVAGANVVQGMLELSNVRPVVEMVDMMATVRAYQGAQRLIDTHHELQRQAVERMLEVTS